METDPTDAAARFATDGCVVLKDVFDPALLDALHQEYRRQVPDAEALPPEDFYLVGHNRLQIAVKLLGSFASPSFYANPMLLEFAGMALGGDFLIDSIAVVTALRQAEDQHLHTDHADLFPDQPLARAMVGAYAATVAIPLVDLTPETGTTMLFAGSHRRDCDKERIVRPFVQRGSCYVMDYRLTHQGMANASNEERPIIYLVYARPWFIDVTNYGNNIRINMGADALAGVPAEHRKLFRRLSAPGSFDRKEAELFAPVERAAE